MKLYRCDTIAVGKGAAWRKAIIFLKHLANRGIIPRRIQCDVVVECPEFTPHSWREGKPSVIRAGSNHPTSKQFSTVLSILKFVKGTIGRMWQNPLQEFVKFSPSQLEVGLWESFLPSTLLEQTAKEVVSERVSHVGVDVNTSLSKLLE